MIILDYIFSKPDDFENAKRKMTREFGDPGDYKSWYWRPDRIFVYSKVNDEVKAERILRDCNGRPYN